MVQVVLKGPIFFQFSVPLPRTGRKVGEHLYNNEYPGGIKGPNPAKLPLFYYNETTADSV